MRKPVLFTWSPSWGLCSSGILRSLDWQLITDVSRNLSASSSSVMTAYPLKVEPIDCPETSAITNLRCVTSQKSGCLICVAAEAWNQTLISHSEINPTRCNNCVYSSQWLYSTYFGWHFHPSSGVRMLYMASGRQVYLCCNFVSIMVVLSL